MIEEYAGNFNNGDTKKALKILSRQKKAWRVKDASMISFFAGTLLIQILNILFLLLVPLEDD